MEVSVIQLATLCIQCVTIGVLIANLIYIRKAKKRQKEIEEAKDAEK